MTGDEAALRRYYDEEARRGTRQQKGPLRVSLLERFVELLGNEGRRSVLDVGSGPGLDSLAFLEAGHTVTAIDLSPENVRQMCVAGVDGVVASLYDMRIEPHSFDAVWTMSTLVHVPDSRFDEALMSMVAAAAPGAPIGIGTWGGFDWEGISDKDEIMPARFFALRDHERLPLMLAEHGDVELYETYQPNPDGRWEYQFAILRV